MSAEKSIIMKKGIIAVSIGMLLVKWNLLEEKGDRSKERFKIIWT